MRYLVIAIVLGALVVPFGEARAHGVGLIALGAITIGNMVVITATEGH